MARYKPIDLSPKEISGDYARQILPGSFEYALCYLIDREMDLSAFAARYRNDDGGAPAYAPALLLKIILLAYSRGLVSSRAIARRISLPPTSPRCANAKCGKWSGCKRKRPRFAPGSKSIRQTGAACGGQFGSPIAPTTSRPRWRRVKA
jgi:hypothetical protein